MHLGVRRLTGVLFALWFAFYLGAPQAVHPCPEHSAATTAVADEHVGHHGSHTGAGQQGGDQQTGDCCCPGPQCAVTALVADAAASASPPVDAVVRAAAPAADVLGSRERPAYSLHLATAPPAPLA
jgi:hypothetical protein